MLDEGQLELLLGLLMEPVHAHLLEVPSLFILSASYPTFFTILFFSFCPSLLGT
jgi:hypothetical protein